jgi:hypothetical protein
MDLGFKDPSYVIIAGRYKNRDYVQTFRIATNDLEHIIRILHNMENLGQVKWIDAPPFIKAVVERELNK